MGDDMVSVPRELVEQAAYIVGGAGGSASVADQLRACLPYEPPAEHVEALSVAMNWFRKSDHIDLLKRLHADGWELRRMGGVG